MTQTPHDMLNERLQNRLKEVIFEMNPEDRMFMNKLLCHKDKYSLENFGGSIEQYIEFAEITRGAPVTMYQASFYINGLNRISPSLLGVDYPEYLDLLNSNNQIAKAWNAIVMPIQTELMKELEEEFATEQRKNKIMSATRGSLLPKTSKHKGGL